MSPAGCARSVAGQRGFLPAPLQPNVRGLIHRASSLCRSPEKLSQVAAATVAKEGRTLIVVATNHGGEFVECPSLELHPGSIA